VGFFFLFKPLALSDADIATPSPAADRTDETGRNAGITSKETTHHHKSVPKRVGHIETYSISSVLNLIADLAVTRTPTILL
jgi:hypothetical protein